MNRDQTSLTGSDLFISGHFDRERGQLREEEITAKFGRKVAGLAALPCAWTPSFIALSISLVEQIRSSSAQAAEILFQDTTLRKFITLIQQHAVKFGSTELIVRSSERSEALSDRGRYLSRRVPLDCTRSLIETIQEIAEDARRVNPNAEIGVAIQRAIKSRFCGHLSNENRVSKTVNQWAYEIEGALERFRRVLTRLRIPFSREA